MLADKQRKELIAVRGEPSFTLEFDIFIDGSLPMWTHFRHGSDFELAKRHLIAIRNHLDEFIHDQNMCPFKPRFDNQKETTV